jgi:hypothetical protein
MRDEKAGSCYDCVQVYNYGKSTSERHDLTHIFNITTPTETGKEVYVDGYRFIKGGEVRYKIDVVINEYKDRRREYISNSLENAIQEAMVAVAYFCKDYPEKVVARYAVVLPPIEVGSSMRYQLMSGEIKGRFIAWFDSSESAELARDEYNFIFQYSALYKTDNDEQRQLQLPKYTKWLLDGKPQASIDFLDKECKVVSNASFCINLLFLGHDVVGHRSIPDLEDASLVELTQHKNEHDAMRYLFLLAKRYLDNTYHFLTPPELYVEKMMDDGVYEVKFKDYKIPLRMTFRTMGTAIEFAQELRNLFEYKAKFEELMRKQYQAYGEPLRIKDYL